MAEEDYPSGCNDIRNDTLSNVGSHLSTPKGYIVRDTLNWERFCWVYRAKGFERYLLVGCFEPFDSLSYEIDPPTASQNEGISSYYYFDDISVVPLSAAEFEPIVDTVVYLCPEDGATTLRLGSNFAPQPWSTGITATEITITAPGWYSVAAEIGSCDTLVDSVRVAFPPGDGDFLPDDTLAVCAAAFPFPYRFRPPAGTAVWSGSAADSLVIPAPGTYIISWEQACGLFRDTLTVVLDEVPRLDLPATLTVCAADLGTVEIEAPPGFADYLWNTGATSSGIRPTQPGTYWLRASHACGVSSDTVIVTSPDPAAPAWPLDTTLCPGEGFELTVPEGFTDFRWADGYTERTRRLATAGTYRLTLEHACGSYVYPFRIQVAPPLDVTVTPPAPELAYGDSVRLESQMTGAGPFRFEWTGVPPPSGDSCAALWLRPTETLAGSLTVTDRFGCQAIADWSVRVDQEIHYYLPNAFSPNDDGTNDRLLLFPGPAVEAVDFVRVYDRWGGLLHTSKLAVTASDIPVWDGRSAGRPAEGGPVTVVLGLRLFDGSRRTVAREVMVLR